MKSTIKYQCTSCLDKKYCKAHTGAKLSIKPNGDVYPCDAFKADIRFLLGNIKTHTLKECRDTAQNHKLLNALAVLTGGYCTSEKEKEEAQIYLEAVVGGYMFD